VGANRLLEILKKETVYATGCTDPIGIALAGAEAQVHLNGRPESVCIKVSPNIYKNANGVGIPGTQDKGVHIAALMGIVTGDAKRGLGVLAEISVTAAEEVRKLLNHIPVKVEISENGVLLYIEVTVIGQGDTVTVIIQEDYANITSIVINGNEIISGSVLSSKPGSTSMDGVHLHDIIDFVQQSSAETFSFLVEGADANLAAAKKGIESGASFGLGNGLSGFTTRDSKLESFLKARSYTAGASDARMAGFPVPIMTVAGSGNHGITALLTVRAVWEVEQLEQAKLAKGLAMSALTTILIKWHVKRMNAFCGCGVAAATGAAAGVVWMLGGNRDQITGAMQSILGSLTGMICDGAKETCSYKVSVASGEAVIQSYLALAGVYARGPSGILHPEIHRTLQYVGRINDPGMTYTDRVILEIAKEIQDEHVLSTL